MSDESARRAAWIAEQIRKKMHHPAVVMGGLSEVLGALALYVEDTERRLRAIDGKVNAPNPEQRALADHVTFCRADADGLCDWIACPLGVDEEPKGCNLKRPGKPCS